MKRFLLLLLIGVSTLLLVVDGKRSSFHRESVTTFRPTTKRNVVNSKEGSSKSPLLTAIRGGNTPPKVSNTLTNAFLGSAVMALIEKATKTVFKANKISFPSQLGACLVLFGFLLLTEVVNADLAAWMFDALSPGAALLAKWLPVFFVPGLALLPLAPPIGNALEVLKVLTVVVLGFVYTTCTTGYAVMWLRKAQGTFDLSAGPPAAVTTTSSSSTPKPFTDFTMNLFLYGSIALGIGTLATQGNADLNTPLQAAFLGFVTCAGYVWGARLPSSFTKLVHPLVTSTAVLLAIVHGLAFATKSDFLTLLKTYKVGTLDPLKCGAGDVLLYLLGPSVVSFAISMYSRRQLLKSNLVVVLVSMLISSVGGLYGTAAFVRAISLGGPNGAMARLSVLSRNVTTALAIALTEMLGGDISIASSVVVLTGILGATYGKTFLEMLKIYDPITRGIGIGSSSQGLGVASMSNEPDAFPFAAISMVLTAICATTLGSIPAVKDSIVNLAGGQTIITKAAAAAASAAT